MSNRSEGNYNRQETNSKYKGNESGFWDNIKALLANNNKPKEREYLHDSQPSSQPKPTEQQAEVTEAPLTSTVPEPEYDYVDYYTETSETDIYSRTFRSTGSTDIGDSNDIGFYTETSNQDSYTLIADKEPAGDYPTTPTTPDDTEGADSNTGGNTKTMLLKILLLGVVVYILSMIYLFYTVLNLFIEESSSDARQKQNKREWRAELSQKPEQEEERFNTLEIGDN